MSDSTHKIVLFSEIDYKGKALVVFGEIKNLFEVLKDWNDKAQSVIVVKGYWELKAGPDYSTEKAVCFSFDGPEGGLYRTLPDTLNKGVTSLLPIGSPR
ncbi:MAG TPA: beta/gamma crystallin-related protein [Cellvibrio sp.]